MLLAGAPAATLNFFAAYSSAARWLGRVSVCRGLSKCCCCTKGRGRGRGGAKGVGASEGAREADPGGEAGTRNLSPMIVIANIFTEVFGTVRTAKPCMPRSVKEKCWALVVLLLPLIQGVVGHVPNMFSCTGCSSA